jgi:asparagine N-glycosylation enzyme membrane subunit Stt3
MARGLDARGTSVRSFARRVAAPLLLFAAALAVRALPYPTVFTAGYGIQPFGNDAYYHLRRIQYAVVNPGEFLSFDRYLNFPHGAQAIWSPAFDWGFAQLVRATTGGDPGAMEPMLMWAPPVLGALTVVALYFIALRHFSTRTALFSAGLLCLLPSHFWYSQIGFLDHHVAVALFSTLLLGLAMSLVGEQPDSDAPSPRALRGASLLGVTMGAALLVWPGSLLHVGMVQGLFGLRALASVHRLEAVAWARIIAFFHIVAFLVVLPLCAGNQWELWGDFSPVVASNFQPLWLGMGALGFAALSERWRLGDDSDSRVDRALFALALVAIGLGIAIWVLPELSRGVVQSWSWFSKDEVFQASVAESAPLLRAPARRIQELFTRGLYLAPLAFLWLVWDRRRSGSAAFWFLLSWSALLLLATLMQRRFMNSASVSYALVMVLALELVFRRLLPGRVRSRALRPFAVAGFALLVGYGLWPSIASYGLDLANLQMASRGQQLHLGHSKRVLLLRSSAAQWLRRLSPETSGYFDAGATPEYSVLTPWGDGHVVKYRGRRPVNQDNFGNDVGEQNFELGEQYFSTDREPKAVEIMQQLGARYVLASAVEVRRSGGYGQRSMFARLSLPKGGATRVVGEGDQQRTLRVLRLVHHRLIFEGVPFEGEPGVERSFYKLYELVEGARVEGSAPPGSIVEARLSLFPRLGGELLFATASQVGASGRYSVTLPYPNEPFSEAVAVEDSYSLQGPRHSVRLRVTEAQVKNGATLEGPSLLQ